MRKGTTALAFTAALMTGNAMADGNQLLTQCLAAVRALDGIDTNNVGFGAGYCMGQVSGVMDMLNAFSEDLPTQFKACIPPPGIQYGQGIRIVTQYLKDHPKFLHLDNAVLIHKSLQTAYPCK